MYVCKQTYIFMYNKIKHKLLTINILQIIEFSFVRLQANVLSCGILLLMLDNQFFQQFKSIVMTVKFFAGIALFVSTQFVSCLRQDADSPKPHTERDKKEIQQIIEVFRTTLKTKDTTLHKSLYVSSLSPINFNLKNQGNPFIFSLITSSWGDFYATIPDYYADYSTPTITVQNGVGISNHHFESYKSGVVDHRGNDMFMYIKTALGFKILSINSTLVAGTDLTDYSSLYVSGNPKDPFNVFTNALNTRDYMAYAKAFLNEAVPCFAFKKQLNSVYSDAEHNSKAFFEALPIGATITITDLKTTVRDQLTAEAVAEFYINRNGKVLERGTLMATVIATKDMPWKISTLVFSLK